MISRSLYKNIWDDLAVEKRMIFMAGPRQVGKTTLSHMIAKAYPNHTYLNWDIPDHRARLIEDPVFFQQIDRIARL